jgi:hypothetical protein
MKPRLIALSGPDTGQAVASACYEHAKRPVRDSGYITERAKQDTLDWAEVAAVEKMTATPELAGMSKAYVRKAIERAFVDARKAESGGRIVQRNGKRVQAYREVPYADENSRDMIRLAMQRFEEEMARLLRGEIDNTAEYIKQVLVPAWFDWKVREHGERAEWFRQWTEDSARSYQGIADDYGVTVRTVRDVVATLGAEFRESFSAYYENVA